MHPTVRQTIKSFVSYMLSTLAQQLKDIGTSVGPKGTDLLNFVPEQQKLEREKRDKERERQRVEKTLKEQKKEKKESIGKRKKGTGSS